MDQTRFAHLPSEVRNVWREGATLFALPRVVVERLNHSSRRFWQPREFAAELALSSYAERHSCLGLNDGLLIAAGPLAQPKSVISREDYDFAGFGEKGITYEQMTASVNLMSPQLDDIYKAQLGYLGYLLTNSRFRRELAQLKQARRRLVMQTSLSDDERQHQLRMCFSSPAASEEPLFGGFLNRWRLSGFACWQLPVPIGGNFTGVPWPDSAGGVGGLVTIQSSPTIKLPLRSVAAQAAADLVSGRSCRDDHLAEWQRIIGGGSGGSGDGSSRSLSVVQYGSIARIYVWLRLALLPRYRHRLRGTLLMVDAAFAEVLKASAETVRKHRSFIHRDC